MTPDENKAAARRFMEATAAGILLEDMIADDFVFWNATTGELPREAMLGMPALLRRALNGPLVITETGITAEGDRVAIEAVSEGELATGERYGNVYHFLIVFAPDGRIRRFHEHLDTRRAQTLLKALGLADPDENSPVA